ncbi:MAG: signal recognition particle-docking protein FtsY [Phycisphaerae bacterium]
MGLLDRFKSALSKTRDKVSHGLGFLGMRRPLDELVLSELERTLLMADVGPSITARFMQDVRAAWKSGALRETTDVAPFLIDRILAVWPDEGQELKFATSGPTVMLIAGINGSGKTTTAAKLARRLQNDGKRVILGACDTFRAAAIEQLAIWAERCGVPIIKHKSGADPGAVAYEACEAAITRGLDVVLLDTAGRLHTQDNLMRELGKIQRVAGKKIPGAPHEVLLVLDATIGQNAVVQAELFAQHVSLTGLVLAKLDGSAKGGVVIGIRKRMGVPVKFVGIGEGIDDLEPFDPRLFVEALFAT